MYRASPQSTNSAQGMNVVFVFLCCAILWRYETLRRADPPSRESYQNYHVLNEDRTMELLSAHQKKLPARNAIYAHAQDFSASDKLLLAVLKAFFPHPLNKQQT
jgi:hypothetical protein